MKSKPDYWYKQSAVIPYRSGVNGLEILLISTRKGKKWTIPKGIIEQDLTEIESCLKEALEEAGVSGILLENKIGKYSYKKWGAKCRVSVYGLRVDLILDNWEEDFRERKWVEIDKIQKYIMKNDLLDIIIKVKKHVPKNS